MFLRTLRNILIIVAGPISIFFLYFINENPENITDTDILFLKILIAIGVATIIVGCVAHVFIKNFIKGMLTTIIFAEIIYIITVVTILLKDPTYREENIMWLSVIILFLILFSLPMAFLISYGIGSIIRDLRKRRQAVLKIL